MPLAERKSVRHEAADRTARKQFAGYAAEYPLIEPAMSVSAGDKQVSVLLLCDFY
jgi:hypothetical protein